MLLNPDLQATSHIAWAVEVTVKLMSSYDVVVEDVGGAPCADAIRNLRLIRCLKSFRGRRW